LPELTTLTSIRHLMPNNFLKKYQRANEILSDPEKRARYDQFGHAGS